MQENRTPMPPPGSSRSTRNPADAREDVGTHVAPSAPGGGSGRPSLLVAHLEARTAECQAAIAASFIRCETASTGELKELWDRDWPPGDVLDGIYLEHVHAELNRRGEGRHCAV